MISRDELGRFALAIERRLGLRVDHERGAAMIELVARRAADHHELIGSYLRRVESDTDELRILASEVTVGETYFFRHIEQFNAFADIVLPERLAHRDRVEVLSAGCSSGEEPLTLAMLVRERVPDPRRVSISGADINPAALARAARGRYSRWALRATPSAVEARWFEPAERDVIISPAIRAAVSFVERNLADDGELWAADRWDVVFCRNVIMYFAEPRAQQVIARIVRSLAPGGYLFLGHAETLRGRSEDLDLCHTHGTFYYQRRPGTAISVPRVPVMPSAPVAPGPVLGTSWYADIQSASERIQVIVDGARRATTVAPDAPPRSIDEARALLAQERFAEALVCLAELPEPDASARDAVQLRAILFAHTGRFAEAEALCREMLRYAELAGARYVLALCRESAGDAAGAEREARLASTLDPSFAMPRLHLGLLARRAGDHEACSLELARAIELIEHETSERLELYGGGFGRQALVDLCRAELAKGTP